MGKDVKRVRIQLTLVQAGIIETDALENQQLACDSLLFFCKVVHLIVWQIYYDGHFGFIGGVNILDPDEMGNLFPSVAAADGGFLGESHTHQRFICLQFQVVQISIGNSLCKGQ